MIDADDVEALVTAERGAGMAGSVRVAVLAGADLREVPRSGFDFSVPGTNERK
jgi:hypothetical protein